MRLLSAMAFWQVSEIRWNLLTAVTWNGSFFLPLHTFAPLKESKRKKLKFNREISSIICLLTRVEGRSTRIFQVILDDELAPPKPFTSFSIKLKKIGLLWKGDFYKNEFWIELKDFIQSLKESIKIYKIYLPPCACLEPLLSSNLWFLNVIEAKLVMISWFK